MSETGHSDTHDDLAAMMAEDADADVVDGLAAILAVCAALRDQRLAQGLTVDEVARRCGCESTAIDWIDDGDVAVPVEALAYYAAAVGLRLQIGVGLR